jgi:hypothetical protein
LYGDFFLLERPGEALRRAIKLDPGDTRDRDEVWLRDLLFRHPDVLPVGDIDPSYGPLRPLCRELRTDAGRIDLAFISPQGRLTLVECKLWRNPEARRRVVAQLLDYARAVVSWTYSDLQREVSAATRRHGNVPYEIAREGTPGMREDHFIDAVTRTMRSGRFLLLIAGDGIREDVGALAELINKNAALGFSFGLIEVALYGLDGSEGVAVQPRVVAKTQLIERPVVIVTNGAQNGYLAPADDDEDPVAGSESPASRPTSAVDGQVGGASLRQEEYRRWWQPVLEMTFDDPDQPPAKLYYPNNIRAQLPWPETWVTAYRQGEAEAGVFLAGRERSLRVVWELMKQDLDAVVDALPPGTSVGQIPYSSLIGLVTKRPAATFEGDENKRAWLIDTLNAYVNVLRPLLKRYVEMA